MTIKSKAMNKTSCILFYFITIVTSALTGWNANAAKNCQYSISPKGVKVKWVAFKTPAKAGVKGSFKELGLTETKTGSSLESVINAAKFKIQTKSISTNDLSRDKTIFNSFFKEIAGGPWIEGQIKGVFKAKKTINLEITMNGVTKNIPLSYKVRKKKVIANGFIDILDFSMSDALKALNKACYSKHQGKTWSDVEITLQAKFSKKCK